ncbi:MAG: hypothetical protein WDM96_14385 [Lacunisphaera sp.]
MLATLRAVEPSPDYTGPIEVGRLAEPRNLEASGLAVSRRTPGLLWTHNDSGGEPILFALNTDGTLRGTLQLAGVTNRDWEDVAAFELDGQAWLMAAEIGDNYAKHPAIGPARRRRAGSGAPRSGPAAVAAASLHDQLRLRGWPAGLRGAGGGYPRPRGLPADQARSPDATLPPAAGGGLRRSSRRGPVRQRRLGFPVSRGSAGFLPAA